MKMKILNMFPRRLSLNGEGGNFEIVKRRLEWSGLDVEVVSDPGAPGALEDLSGVLIGSASWATALGVLEELRPKQDALKNLSESGVPFFAFGLGWEILGESISGPEAEGYVAGVGIFPSRSVRLKKYSAGFSMGKDSSGKEAVGFVNVSSRVELTKEGSSLLELERGIGNRVSGKDTDEGLQLENLFATRLGGPAFSLNPHLADLFISSMTKRSGIKYDASGSNFQQADEYASKARALVKAELGLK